VKKLGMIIPGVLGVATIVSGTYIMLNKKTRKKAEELVEAAFSELSATMDRMQK
jgi:hypothetical protein